MERLVLVDHEGQPIGTGEKLAVHRGGGELHLAFSTLVFNERGEVLLQRRAASKYHFAGLWSNTCCGHPRPGEAVREAAERRLEEEFGVQLSLSERGRLIYRASDAESGLTEHEYLHVFCGVYPDQSPEPLPDPDEIGAWAWRDLGQVQAELERTPELFSPWFPLLLAHLNQLESGLVPPL